MPTRLLLLIGAVVASAGSVADPADQVGALIRRMLNTSPERWALQYSRLCCKSTRSTINEAIIIQLSIHATQALDAIVSLRDERITALAA